MQAPSWADESSQTEGGIVHRHVVGEHGRQVVIEQRDVLVVQDGAVTMERRPAVLVVEGERVALPDAVLLASSLTAACRLAADAQTTSTAP